MPPAEQIVSPSRQLLERKYIRDRTHKKPRSLETKPHSSDTRPKIHQGTGGDDPMPLVPPHEARVIRVTPYSDRWERRGVPPVLYRGLLTAHKAGVWWTLTGDRLEVIPVTVGRLDPVVLVGPGGPHRLRYGLVRPVKDWESQWLFSTGKVRFDGIPSLSYILPTNLYSFSGPCTKLALNSSTS